MKKVLEDIYGKALKEYKQLEEVGLPLYLTENREIYRISLFDTSFIMVLYDHTGRFNLAAMKKYVRKYYDYFQLDIAYGFPSVTTYQRKALVENDIPFIAGNDQLFLPFIGSVFRKCQKENSDKEINLFSPATQLLALFFLYSGENVKFSKNEVAGKIGMSAMSVTRAARDLMHLGLIAEEKKGTENIISRILGKTDYLEKITPYLINPVQKILYIENGTFNLKQIPKAGEYALAERTMLGYPKYEEYALDRENSVWTTLQGRCPDLSVDTTFIRLQKWKYAPKVLSNNGMVDPVSLICSFQEDSDERIQMCLDEVKKEIETWQIMKR